MTNPDYEAYFTIEAKQKDVFKTINNVSKWWTENMKGSSQNLHDEFTVQFGDTHYSKQRLVELVPDQKIVWLVIESKLNFLEDKEEWNNTTISFELAQQNDKTALKFKHIGLNSSVECYEKCVQGWDHFINGSLFQLLTEGKGNPAK
ncbi:SRPBCC domain-containing protein [Segetibacter sp. 3557_3]|uniref:SRPBCC domain-containing protein n=1 Tax=Segetibacter sp. 3557_3 TaxID=2547429 RepID=UPI00105844A2|nr:SRPBCC domain-containing protein [Segetibacter sp. 3557_3]TDH24556.1 SRPBCC domain-containing protein [Segetibacter sp. 3557_3]